MKIIKQIAAAAVLSIAVVVAAVAGLETGTYIHELVVTNPVGATDPKSQGDDHVRLIKSTIKNTFPNITGAVAPTHTELNYVDGVTSAIQTQLSDKLSLTNTSQIINGQFGLAGRMTLGGSHIINTDNVTGFNVRNNANTTQVFHIGDTGIVTAASFRGLQDSGTYTPTAFNCINCGATPGKHMYSRTNNIVTVSGHTSINITSGGSTSTSFQISLPIASNFTDTRDVAGSGSNDDTGAETIRMNANTTDDRAGIFFQAVSTGLGTLIYTFQYEVK